MKPIKEHVFTKNRKKIISTLTLLSCIIILNGCDTVADNTIETEKEGISSTEINETIIEDTEDQISNDDLIDNSLQNSENISIDTENNITYDGILSCPFTANEFEEIYTSNLDDTKYDLSSEYISDYEFWQLNVVDEDTTIVIEGIKEENATSDTIYFYINYGLEEDVFREIVGAFIETLYPDMVQEEHDSLLDKFAGNYMNEDGSYSGIRGEGEINIIMEPWKSLSSNGVKISALKK